MNTRRVCWIWESESTQYLISGDVESDDDGLHNNKAETSEMYVCRIAVGCSERVQQIMSVKCSCSRCFRVCIFERLTRLSGEITLHFQVHCSQLLILS